MARCVFFGDLEPIAFSKDSLIFFRVSLATGIVSLEKEFEVILIKIFLIALSCRTSYTHRKLIKLENVKKDKEELVK